ncbi:MAG TPA: ATP-grasp domain-containing protein [Jiangellaceae bacterium]|nr:ATP-grasp domain-containing protein [Jiangellaceae bacterium]
MNILFIEPAFPPYQRNFARALRAAGAYVMVVSESPLASYDPELRSWIDWHWQVPSVTDEAALEWAVREAQAYTWVDRLEATIEAHVLPAARVRERRGIAGTSARAAWLCRDKPSMKQALREAGIPCAQSAAVSSAAEVHEFVGAVGLPIILKPRDGAGAAGTHRVGDLQDLEFAIRATGVADGQSVAIEEFIEGHEGFVDTLTIGGRIHHEFVSHYFPNVLEAMRTRWISPAIITTNKPDAPQYAEVRAMSQRVVQVLELDTSPTHMEWFFGPKGLKFSEIGARVPGVGQWDLLNEANDMDLYYEWAHALVHGPTSSRPSRRYAAGLLSLRPDRDGTIVDYEGLDEIAHRYGDLITARHFPPPGTPTQPVEAGFHANAWLRARHPDFDTLKDVLADIGRIVQVRAR